MKKSDKQRLAEYEAKERREQEEAAVIAELRTMVATAAGLSRPQQLALVEDLKRYAERYPQMKGRCDRARLKIKAMR